MAGYTVLAECSGALVALLRKELGGALAQANAIVLCSPAERGDAALGVYLYDVEREAHCAVSFRQLNAVERRPAPLPLRLSYMVTAYASGDARYRQEEEQRLLGRVMQVFHDNSVLDAPFLSTAEASGEGRVLIELQRLSFEEKSRIWSALGQTYRLSLFYTVAPVLLDSDRVCSAPRVVSVEFGGGGKR